MNLTFVCILILRWEELFTCVEDSCVLLGTNLELFCSSAGFQTCRKEHVDAEQPQCWTGITLCLFLSHFVLCSFKSDFSQADSAIFSRSGIKIFSRKREKCPQVAATEEGTVPAQLQETNRKSNFTTHAALSWLTFRAQVRSTALAQDAIKGFHNLVLLHF